MGVIGGAGVVAFLAGPFGGFYGVGMGIFAAMAIWIMGATLVILFTDPP